MATNNKEKQLKNWIFIKKFYPEKFKTLLSNLENESLADEIINFLNKCKTKEIENFNFNKFSQLLNNLELNFSYDNSLKSLKKLKFEEIKILSKNQIENYINNLKNLKDKISISNNINFLNESGIEIKETDLLKKLKEYNEKNQENFLEKINFTEEETKIFENFIDNELLSSLNKIEMISHPPKLSHSSANSSKIIAKKNEINKINHFPFLMSGNIDYYKDFCSHPKYLTISKFLFLKLENGTRIFEHLKEETEFIKKILQTDKTKFEKIKEQFLKLEKIENEEESTDEKIKQVYFPVNIKNNLEELLDNYKPEYHLLSILSPTGIILKLKEKIKEINFSKKSQEIQKLKQKNQYSKESYSKILNTAKIKYGGSQPQNISYLNTKLNSSILLSSIPPKHIRKDIYFPKKDFFTESLKYKDFYSIFKDLAMLISEINNPAPKHQADKNKDITNEHHLKNRIEKLNNNLEEYINDIFDKIIEKQEEIREIYNENENIENLEDKLEQRLWLKEDCFDERKNNKNWKDKIYIKIINWILGECSKIGKKIINKNFTFSDENKSQIEETLKQRQQELL